MQKQNYRFCVHKIYHYALHYYYYDPYYVLYFCENTTAILSYIVVIFDIAAFCFDRECPSSQVLTHEKILRIWGGYFFVFYPAPCFIVHSNKNKHGGWTKIVS